MGKTEIEKRTKKAETAYASLVYGKLPPQSPEMEEAVLGALMIDRDTIQVVTDMLSPDMFYKDQHKEIFTVIKDLHEKGSVVDILTVTEGCRDKGVLEAVGGPFYITSLTSRVASAAHVEFHAAKVWDRYVARELIKLCATTLASAYTESDDILDILDDLREKLYEVGQNASIMQKGAILKDLLKERFKSFGKDNSKEFVDLSKVAVRLPEKARIIRKMESFGGGGGGELTILAGRPGMGKTAYMLWEAKMTAMAGYPVLIVSLEMRDRDLVSRLLTGSGVGFRDIQRGTTTEADFTALSKYSDNLIDLPIWIEDGDVDSESIGRLMSFYVRKRGVRRIYIDQISHIEDKKARAGDLYTQATNVTKAVTRACKLLDVPTTLVSQLSRKSEDRTTGMYRPKMSDLKQTGRLEEDATTVQLLWRPEYYFRQGDVKRFEFIKDYSGNKVCSKGYMEIIYAKTRNGSPGVQILTFNPSKGDFEDFYEQSYGPEEKPNFEATDDNPF